MQRPSSTKHFAERQWQQGKMGAAVETKSQNGRCFVGPGEKSALDGHKTAEDARFAADKVTTNRISEVGQLILHLLS